MNSLEQTLRSRRLAVSVAMVVLGAFLALLTSSGDSDVPKTVGSAAHPTPQLAPGPGSQVVQPSSHEPLLPPLAVEVSVPMRAGARPVPESFLGLSTEYWGLPLFASHLAAIERILVNLRPRGGGPIVLRVGGDSAEHSYWNALSAQSPRLAFQLSAEWLRQARSLIAGAELRVILDMNLMARAPQMAAQWARAALAALPPQSVQGFEIGNEPDLYHRLRWYRSVNVARLGIARALTLPRFSADTYVHEFATYARALNALHTGVPLLGPAVANPALDKSWVVSLLAHDRTSLGIVSAHRYPLSQCVGHASPKYPTIARILSERASAGMAQSVQPAILLAHRAGLKFRLTELNSVTCGGRRGVSDSFATALWAPDALFELLRAGADGVNIHVRSHAYNSAVELAADGLHPRPLLYGMILFASALGPRARLLPTIVPRRSPPAIKVWAVAGGRHTLRVVLLNKGQRAARLSLHLPAKARGVLQRLLARSVAALTGVTFAGMHLGSDGRWYGPYSEEQVQRRAGRYVVTLPGMSGALLTVPLGEHR